MIIGGIAGNVCVSKPQKSKRKPMLERTVNETNVFEKTEQVANELLKELDKEQRKQNGDFMPKQVNVEGFRDADIRGGKLIFLGARTSMGKTALALSLVKQIGIDEERPCVYYTSEDVKDTIRRLVETMTGVRLLNPECIKNCGIKDSVAAIKEIKQKSIVIEPLSEYNFDSEIDYICKKIVQLLAVGSLALQFLLCFFHQSLFQNQRLQALYMILTKDYLA